MKVSVAEAKNSLPKAQAGAPKFGTLKLRVKELDSDWWKPMTDEAVQNFLEGR